MAKFNEISFDGEDDFRSWFWELAPETAELVAAISALRAFFVSLSMATRNPYLDLIHWSKTHADIRLALMCVLKPVYPWRPSFDEPLRRTHDLPTEDIPVSTELLSRFATSALENANDTNRESWFEAFKYSALALANQSASVHGNDGTDAFQISLDRSWDYVKSHAVEDSNDLEVHSFSEVLSSPLFANKWLAEELEHHLISAIVKHTNDPAEGPRFSYWREWCRGFLEGKPMDWELQRRVALIEKTSA